MTRFRINRWSDMRRLCQHALCVLVFVCGAFHGIGQTLSAPRYVWTDSPDPASPYTNWLTAAHTIQEAVDVAAYFSQQPRPDFADKLKDWPKGGKPVDARY